MCQAVRIGGRRERAGESGYRQARKSGSSLACWGIMDVGQYTTIEARVPTPYSLVSASDDGHEAWDVFSFFQVYWLSGVGARRPRCSCRVHNLHIHTDSVSLPPGVINEERDIRQLYRPRSVRA